MRKIYEMTRGDTKCFEVRILENDIMISVDEMFLTVKTDCYVEDVLFQKKIGDGITIKDNVYTIIISPENTNELEYGRYVFDVEIVVGTLKRTIEKGVLLIGEEVTFYKNEV